MEDTQVYSGLPSLSLLPLVNSRFKIIEQLRIVLPRTGNFHQIAPTVFEEAAEDFCIMEDNTLYFLPIISLLLATNKYPKLKQNQIFTPLSIKFNDNDFIINGSILEIISIDKIDGGNNVN